MNYVGFCVDLHTEPTQWGPGDVMGYLIAGDGAQGWHLVATHHCSSEQFAENDIRSHFARAEPSPSDLYRWEGMSTMDAIAAKYPPATIDAVTTPAAPSEPGGES